MTIIVKHRYLQQKKEEKKLYNYKKVSIFAMVINNNGTIMYINLITA